MADSVPLDLIERERTAGWPTIHPEDYCHRCGARNMVWFTSADLWKVATAAWAAETGREGICCPACFADLHEQATGNPRIIWEVRPWSPPTETTALAEAPELDSRCTAHDVEGMRCVLDAPHGGTLHKTPCAEGGHWRWMIDCGPPTTPTTQALAEGPDQPDPDQACQHIRIEPGHLWPLCMHCGQDVHVDEWDGHLSNCDPNYLEPQLYSPAPAAGDPEPHVSSTEEGDRG